MQSSLSWSIYLVDLKISLCCRPVDAKIRKTVKLPKVKGVWRVEDRFGDWDVVQSRFFGAGVRSTDVATAHSVPIFSAVSRQSIEQLLQL